MASDTPHDPPALDANGDADRGSNKGEKLQILLAVLLGTAALATAWAAYRGELFSGDSLILLNRSAQTSDQASQKFNAAETLFAQDVALFTEFAVASDKDDGTSEFIKDDLMRPALVKQVEWWAETDDDVGSPFVKQNPFYVAPSQNRRGLQLRAEAAKDFKQARVLDDAGDEYVLYTVLFAAALFLYGIASVATSRKVLVTGMVTGGLLFLFGLVQLIDTTANAPKLL